MIRMKGKPSSIILYGIYFGKSGLFNSTVLRVRSKGTCKSGNPYCFMMFVTDDFAIPKYLLTSAYMYVLPCISLSITFCLTSKERGLPLWYVLPLLFTFIALVT